MSPARQKAAAAEARRENLDYASFLEIILSDEVNRRADRRIELRLQGAGFEETCRLEDFGWSAAITLERRLLNGDGVPNAVQRPRGDLASVLADAPPATSPTHILDAPAPRARDGIAGPARQPPEETWVGDTGQEDGGSQVSGCRSRLTSPRPSSGLSVCRPAVQNASRARTFGQVHVLPIAGDPGVERCRCERL